MVVTEIIKNVKLINIIIKRFVKEGIKEENRERNTGSNIHQTLYQDDNIRQSFNVWRRMRSVGRWVEMTLFFSVRLKLGSIILLVSI